MKLKRILAALLACMTMSMAFVACGDDDDDDKDTKTKKSDKADTDEDEDEDEDEDDEEEETTKKSKKSSSEDDEEEEETTSKKSKDEDDDDLDALAKTLTDAFNTALLELDMDDLIIYDTVYCSDGFKDSLYLDEDDEEFDFDILDEEVENYFEDIDDYEYMVFISYNSVDALFVAESTTSKDYGFYSSDTDRDEFEEMFEDEGIDISSLSSIYAGFEELLAEEDDDDDDDDYSSGRTADEDVAYGVYWAAYWTLSDMSTDPDDALVCSDPKKSIFDGEFDMDDFNENFPDELEFEEVDDVIDDYEYIFVVVDQDVEFAAVAADFDSKVSIFTYDSSYEDALGDMTLNDIIEYFESYQ